MKTILIVLAVLIAAGLLVWFFATPKKASTNGNGIEGDTSGGDVNRISSGKMLSRDCNCKVVYQKFRGGPWLTSYGVLGRKSDTSPETCYTGAGCNTTPELVNS